ncbi:MAG: AI-2E family transporter [Syntrophomonadaceae bacterium]|nr:AI-2E family transporter [Syntrophomonadaceae bacterium]
MQLPIRVGVSRVILLAVLLGGGLYLLYLVREVLPPFIWGGIFAYLLERPVSLLEKMGWKRTGAILLVFFALGGVLALLLMILLPNLMQELETIGEQLPRYLSSTRGWFVQVRNQYESISLPLSLRLAINEAMLRVEEYLTSSLRRAVEAVLFGYSSLLTVVFTPILAYYLLRDAEAIKRRFISLLPNRWRGDVVRLLGEVDEVLLGFLKGNLLVASIVGAITALVLMALGVDFALTLGFIAGVFDLIPYLGPILGGIPAVVIALQESTRLALYTGLAILAIHQVESGIIAPKILGNRVGLNPLLVIFALLAGGKLWGGLGMVIAVPVAATLRVVVSHLFNRWLGA